MSQLVLIFAPLGSSSSNGQRYAFPRTVFAKKCMADKSLTFFAQTGAGVFSFEAADVVGLVAGAARFEEDPADGGVWIPHRHWNHRPASEQDGFDQV